MAPASPFDRDAFARGVTELAGLGFDPVFDERVFDRRGYVAGDAASRAAALHDAWRDDRIRAVFVARGGYGSVQLLPLLDARLARAARKPLVGYSDITSLLSFLTLSCGVVAFHGPSVAGCLGRGDAAYDRDTLVRALTSPEPLGPLACEELAPLKAGRASGPLLGGTLTQLVGSLGTRFAFDPPDGFVLLLDEVGERPYRLDRMLTQLAMAGVLERASGIISNQLPNCDEPGGRITARETLADVLRNFPGPVLFGLRTGHTPGQALTIPLGVRVRIDATRDSASFSIVEAAVEP
ncbi:MAG: S66 peptidase family protein [Bacteroidales bacterium]